MPMPRRPMGQIPYPVPETPTVSGVNMGFADVPSNLGAYLSGAPAPDKIQSLGMNVSMPRQAMLPRPTGGRGGAPTIPVSQNLVDPNAPNTLGQTPGSSIKDTALGFLKGLGGMLAESGYAMAHRSGGNADDYKSHWNEDVITGNPNSDFSRQSQDYMSQTYPGQFSTPEQKARLSNLSGDEIRGLNPMYNQSQYLDYLRGASQMKNDVAMARINQPKAARVSGGGGMGNLSKQEMAQLPKYSALKQAHEGVRRDLEALKQELGTNDLSSLQDIPGVANVPYFGVVDNQGKGARIRSLIEKIVAPERHKLFGSALTGTELGSANRIYGQSGFSDTNILKSVHALDQAQAEDYQNLDAGYTDNVTNFRENKLQRIGAQSPSPQSSGGRKKYNPATGRVE